MKLNLNKSFLAPQADELSSIQLKFLLINSPFTVIINNYKSNFSTLNSVRSLVLLHNGFSYHPNKNVKIRAFKGFNTVLSPDLLNGLVIFAFFAQYKDLTHFLKAIDSKFDLTTVSYFSLLVDGHVVGKGVLNDSFNNDKMFLPINTLYSNCNKTIINSTFGVFNHSLNKIYFIIDAYTKSIN